MNLPKNEASPVLKNPFYHRGPIRDRRYFFGRSKETRQALQMLGENQCISAVGPRRIGKTSFLLHLCDPEVRKEYGIGDEHLFVYVDCQGLEDLDRLQFYQWLWKEARKALKERGESEGWAQSISNFNDLRDAMEMVQNRGYRPTFLFDEFESLATNKGMDRALFSSLRNLSEGFQVTYATASQMPLLELTYYDDSILKSPFFNNFQAIPLSLLEPGEAREMVLSLTEMIGRVNYFSEEDLSFAFAVAGYQPFFLQVACYHLFERKTERGGLTAEDYEAVRQRYVEDVERYFHHIWSHSEMDEQESMRLACEGKVSDLSAEQRQRLERKCVLYGDALFSSAFTEFIRKQAGTVPKKVSAPIPSPPETAMEHALTEATQKIAAHIEQAIAPEIREIRSMLEDISLGGLEFLGNFEGLAIVEIADTQENLIPLSEEEAYVLSEGQTYQLRVTIQSQAQEPSEGSFDVIRLTDGQDVDTVNFTVSLDCDSLRLRPAKLEFTIGTRQAEAVTRAADLIADREGDHTIFVVVYQKSALVQIIRLDLKIRQENL